MSETITGKRFKHKKRGSEYIVVGIAQGQCSNRSSYSYLGIENKDFVVYKSDDGYLWIRPIDEFLDGRFEEIE